MRIGAITLIEGTRVNLMRQWVGHYSKWCRREDMHVRVMSRLPEASPVERYLNGKGVNCLVDGDFFHTIDTHRKMQVWTRNIFGHWDGWHFNVDSDEFFDREVNVHSLVDGCEANGWLFVKARMTDMVARNGLLPPIGMDKDMYATFPIEYDVTGKIVKGYTTKFPLCKNPYYGYHNSYGPSGMDQKRDHHPSLFKLHHFKWDATAVDRMRHRVENKDRFRYWGNFKLFLDYYEEHGKILIP